MSPSPRTGRRQRGIVHVLRTALRCRECGREYPLTPTHVCEYCFGPLEVAYDYDGIKKAISREASRAARSRSGATRDLLPVDGEPWTCRPASRR